MDKITSKIICVKFIGSIDFVILQYEVYHN